MKKILITLVSLVIFQTTSYGQIPYHDALALSNMGPVLRDSGYVIFPVGNSQQAYEILKAYVDRDKVDYATVKKSFEDNPFIRLPHNAAASTIPTGGTIKGLVSNVGGLDVTNIADGLARFLVARMKQELSVMFFDRFNKFLEEHPDAKALFPKTHSMMLLASDKIYDYQSYLPALRVGFEEDLASLLQNTNDWINTEPARSSLLFTLYHSTKQEDKATLACLRLALGMALDIENGKHPGDILHETNFDSLKHLHPNVPPAFQTADLISQSLRSDGSERYWITREQFKKFEDEIFTRIYLGLIYQQAVRAEIKFSNGKTLAGVLKESATTATEIKQTVKEIRHYVSRVKLKLDQIEAYISIFKKDSIPEGVSHHFSFVQNIASITQETIAAGFLKPAIANAGVESGKFSEVQFYMEHGGNLLTDIRSRSYNAAIFDVAIILEKLLGPKSEKFNSGLIKYGSFMATVTSAESSAEVQDAIEAVALPAGSALIKRSVPFNISINSYIGFHYGEENLEDVGWSRIYGISAPVGIAVSTDLRGKNGSALGSLSGFVSLIDVGAIASFRVKDDSTAQLPEIKLENIFAPGIYAVWGIGRTPISIGYGWQKGPQLREVNVPDANTGELTNVLKDGYRWSVFISVDIPLFNLYTKPR